MGKSWKKKNFRIHLIDTKEDRLGEWTSKKLEEEIQLICPDVVYFIGGHTAAPLMQIIKLKKFRYNNMRILAFSMRGHTPTIDFKKMNQELKNILIHLAKG